MAGDAYQVIEKFWENQDSGDYTTTENLFAEDACGPYIGTFQGREQIGAFLLKMNQVVIINGVFRLEQLSGNETTAWLSGPLHRTTAIGKV